MRYSHVQWKICLVKSPFLVAYILLFLGSFQFAGAICWCSRSWLIYIEFKDSSHMDPPKMISGYPLQYLEPYPTARVQSKIHTMHHPISFFVLKHLVVSPLCITFPPQKIPQLFVFCSFPTFLYSPITDGSNRSMAQPPETIPFGPHPPEDVDLFCVFIWL